MKPRTALLAALLAATTAIAGCSGSSSKKAADSASSSSGTSCTKTTSISIATTPYQDSLIMTLGNKLGWYAKACLKVTFKNVDFNASKNFLLFEDVNLQFRAEMFNLFNHTNYSNPDNGVQDEQFGQILSAAGPGREVQFALKLLF